MGRSAGWLAYGAAIAGEASLVISVEDITGKYATEEDTSNSEDRRRHQPPRDEPRRGRQADRAHDARPREAKARSSA